jgi:hypothetical protein
VHCSTILGLKSKEAETPSRKSVVLAEQDHPDFVLKIEVEREGA